jgi:hypothetical protein
MRKFIKDGVEHLILYDAHHAGYFPQVPWKQNIHKVFEIIRFGRTRRQFGGLHTDQCHAYCTAPIYLR